MPYCEWVSAPLKTFRWIPPTPDWVNRIFSNPSAHKHLHIIYLKYVQVEYWRHPALSLSPSSPSIQVSKHPGLLYHNYEGFDSQLGLDVV